SKAWQYHPQCPAFGFKMLPRIFNRAVRFDPVLRENENQPDRSENVDQRIALNPACPPASDSKELRNAARVLVAFR
ncbi:hypothetical protein, partial [Erythrobacter sp. QSSC1-22B]|uniref:hypothetical protein n=1 Tax=Erythrobacter sp. QSSC1-22B TaxID=1860125 RepID=UPI001F369E94